MEFTAFSIVYLFSFLLLIASSDLREHRVPNVMVLALLIGGLLFSMADGGLQSLSSSLQGATVGLVLLPMYLFRAMGAGDVKLLVACGTFLGPWGILQCIVVAFVLGAVFVSIIWSSKQLKHLARAQHLEPADSTTTRISEESLMQEKVPFAPAIALAAIGVVFYQLGAA